ncbi:hypothetical protein VTO42DRAFT_4047 [Malbranchea cinnamomea]
MSYTQHRFPFPDRGGYVGPISASMGSLSLNDTDPYYRHPGSGHEAYRTTTAHPIETSPRVYYESKRTARAAGDGVAEAIPVSSRKHNAAGQKVTPKKTAYIVRPRSRTSSESGWRPQLLVSSSPGRQSDLTLGYEKSRAPQGYYYANDDTTHLVIPGSSSRSNQQRVYSVGERDSRGRTKGYIMTGGNTYKRAVSASPASSQADIEIYDSYSYTNPREQFYRDSDHIQAYRRETTRQNEHTSSSDIYGPQSRREWRRSGPPPSTRGFDRILVDDNRRSIVHNSYDSPKAGNRRRSQTSTVMLHQSSRGEYSDLSDPRDFRIRRDPDGTVIVEDKLYISSQGPERYAYRPADRDAPSISSEVHAGDYSQSSRAVYGHDIHPDPSLNERESWERLRKGQRNSVAPHNDNEDESSKDDDRDRWYRTPERQKRESSAESADHRRKEDRSSGQANGYDGNKPANNQQKKVHVVEPKPPPKGILKRPTEKFPEDPNAVREGVAPLKDAVKKGIPPGARWTKIDRRLVSPAVLEGQERYEVRPEYVIVLRVLTKEEIHAYALKTAEVRAARYRSDRRDYGRDRDRYRDEGRARRNRDETDSDDDEKEPLAIEAPPDSRYEWTRSRS